MSDGDNLSDLKGNLILGQLQNLHAQNKISYEKYDDLKTKFQTLHDAIVKTYQNVKVLPAKANKLKAELKYKRDEYEQAQLKSEEIEQEVKKAQSQVKKAEAEEELERKIIEQMNLEAERKSQELTEENMKIQELEKEARMKIYQEEEKLKQDIETLKGKCNQKQQDFDKTQKQLNENLEKIQRLKKENEEYIKEQEKLQNEFLQNKDEPERHRKKADMLESGKKMMERDLKLVEDTNKQKDKEIEELKDKNGKLKILVDQNAEDNKNLKRENQIFQEDYTKQKGRYTANEEEMKILKQRKYDLQVKLNEYEIQKKKMNEEINQKKKEIDVTKKMYKQLEKKKNDFRNQIREFEISIDKYTKEQAELKYEREKMLEVEQNVEDDTKLIEFRTRRVKDKISSKESEYDKIQKQIQDLEQQLQAREEFEANALKKVKRLTAMRESMARKASQAMHEVRETRQQLKIKELAIKDLEKKYQEIKFERNNCKVLYEAVKAERNKYVNYIQSTQQDLAEVKEQNKISQNELEIFKNEYQEKHQNLIQYQHTLQIQKHQRDGAQAELNAQEFIRRAKKEQVDRNINEIEKLNMIIRSLENESLDLRRKYEKAQESRNFTGVQLIDRNDELCIMYEKSNNQETTLRSGEVEIKKLEDEIRMIKITIQETMRKIDVSRKQIQDVPVLADEVVNLQNELKKQQQLEAELSEQLENPTNEYRYRDLKGEDPDQEALDTKIGVLEERLNNKKEQLLEKELILDEITNFSEKLRKQALDGRQNTLELSEKLNNFQAKLKDITKKMMASISELSMFQATSIKLQQERDELVGALDESKQRVEQNLPPTPECEVEYLKRVRDKKRCQEECNLRLQREALEKNFPPFATKTFAEHRVNAYIPDEIGIPKPYGKHAPFKPFEPGSNMRHFKNPLIKDVEI
ncbi:hypothetical protein ABPG72_007408 [Tetrahymena utriculariae]